MTDTPETESPPVDTRRVARWALLGAGSGALAWGLVWAVDGAESALFLAPGLVFGLAVGLALYRLGHARVWQVALLAVVSVLAWYIAINTSVNLGWGWSSASYGIAASVGGLVWSAIQTAAIVILFPFARRPRLWVELLLAGGATAGLVTEALYSNTGDVFFVALWAVWYAVYAAVLSTALPAGPENR